MAEKKLTKADVDYIGALSAQVEGLKDELEALKEQAREQFGPSQIVEGYAFVLSIGKVGETKAKVDYRARLVNEWGEAKVLKLENETEKLIVGERAASVSIKINPAVKKNPELLLKSKEVLEKMSSVA